MLKSAQFYEVPQGSVLGPLLFLQYIAEVAEVLAAHGFKGHSYADDTQMYISVPAAEAVDAALRLSDCIVSVESWMSSHRLKMNPDKTQLLWIGTRPQLSKVAVNEVALSTGPLGFSTVVSNLGVLFSGGSRISERGGGKDEAPQEPRSSRRRREDRGIEGAEGVG